MARQRVSILNVLVGVPWWTSVVVSATAFVMLRFVFPMFIPPGPANSSDLAFRAILGAAPVAAPFVALVLLVPVPVAAFRQWRERRLLDRQEDLATIRALSWSRFETLIVEAYRRQGYSVWRPSGKGPDGGVDLVLRKDGNTLVVQCKQWKAWKVGVREIRELYSVMIDRKAQGAIVVASGIFTQEAQDFAKGKPIDLIGGQQLVALIHSVQAMPSPSPAARQAKRSSVAAPSQPAPAPTSSAQKLCPQCGHPMVLRTVQDGSQSGQQFWGCSQFPICQATERLG